MIMAKDVAKQEGRLDIEGIMRMAVQVSDRVQLEDVRLVGCNSTMVSFPEKGPNNFEVTASTEFTVDKEKSVIFVLVHFGLNAVKSKGEPLAKIRADMLLGYNINNFEGLTDAHFKCFAEQNAIFNAWPYWREFIQSMTTRMQLPPLILPVHRFGTKLPEKRTLKGKGKKPITTRVISTTKKPVKKVANQRRTKKA